jgi:aryl-alcohol dehydrogenase-like predicted oxidoreductase
LQNEGIHAFTRLSWLLSKKVVVSVLIGVRTVDQLLDNLGVLDLKPSEEEIIEMKKVSAPDLGYSNRFLQIYGIRE